VDKLRITKAKGGKKILGADNYDGYAEDEAGAGGSYMAAEFLDGMQQDGDEEAPDNDDVVSVERERESWGDRVFLFIYSTMCVCVR
jgi:hypothetical protein